MFELVGNSVPPLLAEAVAKPVVKLIRDYYKQVNTKNEII
jgi:DNA (cytosine-5)-methyltransferase 1